MQARLYEFNTSFETSTQPDAGVPALTNDLVTLGFMSGLIRVLQSSSRASPYSVVAGTGIPFAAIEGYAIYALFAKGSSGAVDVSANPQIAAGSIVGQILIIIGCNDDDSFLLEDGDGLEMKNGNINFKNGSIAAFIWDGTQWSNMFWNNVGDLG